MNGNFRMSHDEAKRAFQMYFEKKCYGNHTVISVDLVSSTPWVLEVTVKENLDADGNPA